ncbi:hypothetical protein KJ695_03760 [Patescibacteria group bacterium]|nr:hypothetical protein [Patescibacteria group bacterium]
MKLAIDKIASDYSFFWGMILNASIVLVAFIGFLFIRIGNRKKYYIKK